MARLKGALLAEGYGTSARSSRYQAVGMNARIAVTKENKP